MEETVQFGPLKYGVETDGTAFVSDNPTVRLTEVLIPPAIVHDGTNYPVTAVGQSAFHLNSNITAVKFPGDSQVRLFDEGAFQNTKIALLQIPATLTSLHKSTFRHTPQLVNLELQGGNTFVLDDNCLFTRDRTELLFVPRNRTGSFVIPASVIVVGQYALDGCSQIAEITFADHSAVTILGDGAFSGTKITQFEVPATVTTIGAGFLQNCASLSNITFAPTTNLYRIPKFAFADSGLVELAIPNTITGLGQRAFSKTSSLKSVRFANQSKLTDIESDAFWSSSIESLQIPDSVEAIAPNFFSCEKLNSITISPTHKHYTLRNDILTDRDCKRLLLAKRTVEICVVNDTVEAIAAYAFCHCRRLQLVKFGEDSCLCRIDAYAFFTTALTSIQIPPGVTVIGEAAFASCHRLCEVRFPPESQLVELGRRAFGQTTLTTFNGPPHLATIGPSVFANSKIQTVIFPEGVEVLPPLLFFRCALLQHVILKSGANVTAANTAFDEANPALQIHIKQRDRFHGQGGLNVTEDIPEDLLARVSEVYERASRTQRQLRDIVLRDEDRQVVPSWPAKEGKFGRVTKARHVHTGEISAVKTLKKLGPGDDDAARQKDLLIREIEAMKKMIHPAILGLIGFIPPPAAGRPAGEVHCGRLVTEFMPNDTLASLIAEREYAHRPATLKVKIAVGVAAAMRYMHAAGIVHRDLKPLNILLDDRWEPKLADFGSARAGNWALALTLTAEVGTVLYAAPETFTTDEDGSPLGYGPPVDVYAYGITLWEIVTGIRMVEHFNRFTPYQFQQNVKERHLRPPVDSPGVTIVPWVAELLGHCWDGNPSQRPAFEAILQEFRAHRFGLLPGTDAGQVDGYLSAIQEYEREHPPPAFG